MWAPHRPADAHNDLEMKIFHCNYGIFLIWLESGNDWGTLDWSIKLRRSQKSKGDTSLLIKFNSGKQRDFYHFIWEISVSADVDDDDGQNLIVRNR